MTQEVPSNPDHAVILCDSVIILFQFYLCSSKMYYKYKCLKQGNTFCCSELKPGKV